MWSIQTQLISLFDLQNWNGIAAVQLGTSAPQKRGAIILLPAEVVLLANQTTREYENCCMDPHTVAPLFRSGCWRSWLYKNWILQQRNTVKRSVLKLTLWPIQLEAVHALLTTNRLWRQRHTSPPLCSGQLHRLWRHQPAKHNTPME